MPRGGASSISAASSSPPTSSPASISGALVGRSPHAGLAQTLLLAVVVGGRLARRRVPVRALRPRGPARVGQRRQRSAQARPHLPRRVVAAVRAADGDGRRTARRRRLLRRAGVRRRGRASAARAPAWSPHRAPRLRQRTLIVGSGLVASRLAERIQDHPELGLDARPASSTTASGEPGRRRPSLPRRPERAQRPRRARPASTA